MSYLLTRTVEGGWGGLRSRRQLDEDLGAERDDLVVGEPEVFGGA
jgi:hypothetical protein